VAEAHRDVAKVEVVTWRSEPLPTDGELLRESQIHHRLAQRTFAERDEVGRFAAVPWISRINSEIEQGSQHIAARFLSHAKEILDSVLVAANPLHISLLIGIQSPLRRKTLNSRLFLSLSRRRRGRRGRREAERAKGIGGSRSDTSPRTPILMRDFLPRVLRLRVSGSSNDLTKFSRTGFRSAINKRFRFSRGRGSYRNFPGSKNAAAQSMQVCIQHLLVPLIENLDVDDFT
jgi:hypothetical protein